MPDELARTAPQAGRTRKSRPSHHAGPVRAGRGNVAGTNITIRSRTDTTGRAHPGRVNDRDQSADQAGAARLGRDLDRAGRPLGGSRGRQLAALVVLLAVLAGLWLTRDRWFSLVTSTNPYQASPAANFRTGSDGIVTQKAEAVDGMSADQVADALGRVKQALEAAYLDDRLLVDHDPAPVLNLLAPDSATTVRRRFEAGQYGTAMVQLAAGTTLAAAPRSSGWMHYQRVDWEGRPALDVTTNVVFAYAFVRPSGVVVIHTETHWMFPLGNDMRPSSRGMFLGRTNGYWHGMNCTLAATGRTAPAIARDWHADPDYHETDSLDAYFDATRSVEVTSACR